MFQFPSLSIGRYMDAGLSPVFAEHRQEQAQDNCETCQYIGADTMTEKKLHEPWNHERWTDTGNLTPVQKPMRNPKPAPKPVSK